MAGILIPPGTNDIPSPPPTGGPPPPHVPPSGPGHPLGVPPPPPGPDSPPGPGPPLLTLVDLLPVAPSQSHASEAARPVGPLVPGAIAAAPGGWAGRPRADRLVPAPRYGMRRAPSSLPPTTGHSMVVCLSGRGPAPVLASCVLPSSPASAGTPASPAAVLASAPALFSTLSSFRYAFALGSGRK